MKKPYCIEQGIYPLAYYGVLVCVYSPDCKHKAEEMNITVRSSEGEKYVEGHRCTNPKTLELILGVK